MVMVLLPCFLRYGGASRTQVRVDGRTLSHAVRSMSYQIFKCAGLKPLCRGSPPYEITLDTKFVMLLKQPLRI